MRCRWRSRPPTARSWTAASRWAQVRSRRQLEARRPAVHRRPPTTRLRSLDAATLTCKPCRDYRTSTPGAKTEVANQLGALMDTPGPAPRLSSPSTPPPRPTPARSPNNPARPAWSTSAGQPYTPSRDALATFADNSRHASPRAATLYRQPASSGRQATRAMSEKQRLASIAVLGKDCGPRVVRNGDGHPLWQAQLQTTGVGADLGGAAGGSWYGVGWAQELPVQVRGA
jgi:hypothetical protein